ncbi:MAG: type II secretion system F family protein [Chloroflexi bacterium]|nr:type II secretion system F family protein [Chloroflexota bacterium]MBI3931588.1 type II secretion system F family protein [Chloroflexota bacterium]
MAYQYVAYNKRGEVVKGKLSAATEEAATELLGYAGYQPVSLKPYVSFFNIDKLTASLFEIKVAEIILLYRQLAMLLEAGTNIATSLELLQAGTRNRALRRVLSGVISDVRSGTQLSTALLKHPKVFSPIYCQLLGVGEQGGNLELVLNQIADYMEKEATTIKETKSALMMPAITAVIAVVVVGLLVTFILPTFAGMYESLGVQLPPIARIFLALGEQAKSQALYLFLGVATIIGLVLIYIKTPRGRYLWDKMLLKLPRVGQVRLLSELARYCRSMALLFRAGMPLTEIMPMLIRSSNNKVLAKALTDVEQEMLKGEGLSQPMAKNKLFLPMMVQMVRVGEESGNLEATLLAVARSYEAEAEDKIRSLITLIPPAMTLIIGGMVGLIAVTLMSAMTSMYSEGF